MEVDLNLDVTERSFGTGNQNAGRLSGWLGIEHQARSGQAKREAEVAEL